MSTYAKGLAQNPDRKNKKEVRDFLFSYFMDMELDKIVGLAGPKVTDYIQFCKTKGFSDFEIYETDAITAIHQLVNLKDSVQLKLKNITEANPDEPHTLYDLDFCGTVRYLKEPIRKFKERFIMTFSLRVSLKETIQTFFGERAENILSVIYKETPLKHFEYVTDGGKYLVLTYRDTTPMCCFAKIH